MSRRRTPAAYVGSDPPPPPPGHAGPDLKPSRRLATPLVTVAPALLPHQARLACAKMLAATIMENFLDFAEVAAEMLREKDYERLGYADPEPFLVAELGIAYRTLRRFLVSTEALTRVPEAERPALRQALIALGAHKAAALAPIIGRPGTPWAPWIDKAKAMRVAAVQEAVNGITGRRRPTADINGNDPFRKHVEAIFQLLPDRRRERAEEIWRRIARSYVGPGEPSMHPIAVLLTLLEIANTHELAARGQAVDEGA